MSVVGISAIGSVYSNKSRRMLLWNFLIGQTARTEKYFIILNKKQALLAYYLAQSCAS
jgi:hypothetical protein